MKLAPLMAAAALLAAQTPPQAIENTGKPMQLQGRCTMEIVRDLGLACGPEEPCQMYLDLSSLQAVGDRLVIAGNIHSGGATLESVLLVSDDAGRTWTESHPRIPNAVLDRLHFRDFEVGWVNGHLLQPLPRDAFFLITTDGGKTWRKRPLFGEPRSGAIEQYWFESRTQGQLVIENPEASRGQRYELWESMNGGESWSIRQVDSKPAAPPASPAAPTGWRLRPDAATKTHRVERQAGAKWETVASFRVSAGECRPEIPVSADPPPPVELEPPAATPPKSAKPPSLKRKP
jgi:hypothetical protein